MVDLDDSRVFDRLSNFFQQQSVDVHGHSLWRGKLHQRREVGRRACNREVSDVQRLLVDLPAMRLERGADRSATDDLGVSLVGVPGLLVKKLRDSVGAADPGSLSNAVEIRASKSVVALQDLDTAVAERLFDALAVQKLRLIGAGLERDRENR